MTLVVDFESYDPSDRSGRPIICIDPAGEDHTAVAMIRYCENDVFLVEHLFNLNRRKPVDLAWSRFMEWLTDLGNFLREPTTWRRNTRRAVIATLPVSLPLWFVITLLVGIVATIFVQFEVIVASIIGYDGGTRLWTNEGRGWRRFHGRGY